jgi:hypothetical protein
MKITILNDETDNVMEYEVDGMTNLEDLRVLIEVDSGIMMKDQVLKLAGRELVGDKKTLG